MNFTQFQTMAFLSLTVFIFVVVTFGYMEWRRYQARQAKRDEADRIAGEKRHDEELAIAETLRRKQDEWEARRYALDRERLEAEQKRIEAEEAARYDAARAEEERAAANNSGAGSGGYHLITIDESDRSLFHDLLKGFEDYANLKGYRISFSIDNSWDGRTAYKFTVLGKGVVVGSEQVRADFRDYVDRVRKDDDDFDDIPIVTSMAEHHLLVTMLKNRIEFFRSNYKLYKNTVALFDMLVGNNRLFPAQPQPSVVVHTGGSMDSRSYSAVNSQKVLQGDGSSLSDSSINIGGSVNEKMERITALDDMIAKLKTEDLKNAEIAKAGRELSKVRDELAENPQPNESVIRRWLEAAKNSMTLPILGYETVEGARKLWELFGMK
jgi:hypothetical protein